jgi:hypothetical protein
LPIFICLEFVWKCESIATRQRNSASRNVVPSLIHAGLVKATFTRQ